MRRRCAESWNVGNIRDYTTTRIFRVPEADTGVGQTKGGPSESPTAPVSAGAMRGPAHGEIAPLRAAWRRVQPERLP